MTIKEAFKELAMRHGSHKEAALSIGYSPEHYRGMRNGRFPIPAWAEKAILSAAQEIPSNHPPSRPERCGEVRA